MLLENRDRKFPTDLPRPQVVGIRPAAPSDIFVGFDMDIAAITFIHVFGLANFGRTLEDRRGRRG